MISRAKSSAPTPTNIFARSARRNCLRPGKAHEPSKEYGVALGGPIIPNIAHFFFTWEHKSLANYSTVFPAACAPSAISLLPASVSSQFGPVTNPFKENLYFGKIDVEPTQNDRIEVTGNPRWSKRQRRERSVRCINRGSL